MFPNLSADFVRNGFDDVFELVAWLVDVARNSPNQFEAIQQRRQGFFDRLQVTAVDVLELTVKCRKKLNKVLGLSVMLGELLLLGKKSVNQVVFAVFI